MSTENVNYHFPSFRTSIGPLPDPEFASTFDVVIALHDLSYDLYDAQVRFKYWFPVNEVGRWGYAPFYGFKRVFDYHHAQRHEILVHCARGMHRSPIFFLTWLISKGYSQKEAIEFFKPLHDGARSARNLWIRFEVDVQQGRIPSDVHDLLAVLEKDPDISLINSLCAIDAADRYADGPTHDLEQSI